MEMHDDATKCGVGRCCKNFLWTYKPWFEVEKDKKITTCLGVVKNGAITFTIASTIIISCRKYNKYMWEV
jgi:hypothetical protein